MSSSKIIEKTSKGLFMAAAVFSILAVLAIFVFLFFKGLPAFSKIGFFNFIFGDNWSSSSFDTFKEPLVGKYGILTMIIGSIFATIGALLVGGIFGLFSAICLSQFCGKTLKKVLSALINLLAGIPSVVYGFFGMKFLLPILGEFSANGSGSGIAAVSIILGIMILPTIVAISKNSIDAVPKSYYEGARALGASEKRAIFTAVVPAAKSGIIASLILGIGRAIGETMAVVMIAGNSAVIPDGLFASFRTMTANIVLEMGYAGEVQMSALIATGVILLVFIVLINLLLGLVLNDKKTKNKLKKQKAIEDSGVKPLTNKFVINTGKVFRTIKIKLNRVMEVIYLPIKKTFEYIGICIERFLSAFGKIISIICIAVVTLILVGIIAFIFRNGFEHINWTFLSTDFEYGGAVTIFPSIIATLMLIFLCVIFSIPLGIMAAIYLHEYTKRGSRFVKAIRFSLGVLSGVPSIVYGLFGMVFFCGFFGLGTSIIAGALTVSIMILPTIVRTTEESLIAVEDTYREASLALGASKLRTIFKIVLPCALPGIFSAIILSIGRVVSESAPLMFTMGASLKPLPQNGFSSSGTTLAVALYKLAGEGLHVNEAYATACVLIIIVLLINMISGIVAMILRKRQLGE